MHFRFVNWRAPLMMRTPIQLHFGFTARQMSLLQSERNLLFGILYIGLLGGWLAWNTMKLSVPAATGRVILSEEEKLWTIVKSAGQLHNVSPQLLWAMISVESKGDEHAVSKSGAMGLMQLMPGTAKALRVSDPYDPEENIHAGAKYMARLLERYNGRADIALAAYNAGPAAVGKHRGIPPFKETRRYVAQVLGLWSKNINS